MTFGTESDAGDLIFYMIFNYFVGNLSLSAEILNVVEVIQSHYLFDNFGERFTAMVDM